MSETSAEERSFLQEMDQNPDAMELRLIFADWLEEQRDPRADLIRQLVEVHQEKCDLIDLRDPERVWAALRAFAKPQEHVSKLTGFQERMIPVWEKLWMQIGLCTRPTNRERAEHFVREAYRHTQGKEPTHIEWYDSPLGAHREALVVSDDPQFEFITWFSDEWPHGTTMAAPGVERRIDLELASPIGEVIGNDVSGPVERNVLERLGRDDREDHRVEYGAWSAYGLSKRSFLHHVCCLAVHPAMLSEFQLALDINIWFPFADRVLISEKPEQIVLDSEGLQQISYRDGYSIVRESTDD